MTLTLPLRASALALSLGAACLLLASQSPAYCRTRTCNPTKSICDHDKLTDCIITGELLHWRNGCVSFSVNQMGSPLRNISFDTADNLITDAFSKWLAADCGDGNRPALAVNNFGPTACGERGYNPKGPNSNEWMFIDSAWMPLNDAHTLALTTVTHHPTGEILDVDVEINSANSLITTGDTNIGADLESIVTHEAGHFLGLAHSEVTTATMFGSYLPGNPSMRDLDPDDVLAICAAYPQGRPVASSSCEPRGGFTKQCSDELSTGGCGCHVASPEDKGLSSKRQSLPLTTSGFSLVGAAFALWVRRRRRNPTNNCDCPEISR